MCQTCAIPVRYLTNLPLSNVYLPILTPEIKEQVDVPCRPTWEKPVLLDAPTPAGANLSQPQNFAQFILGQRPGGPQHRGSNGVNPYTLFPTSGHQSRPNHTAPSATMGQLGPSPYLPQMAVQSRMLPLGSNMGAVPSVSFSRPPSRSGMMQRSPSFAARQPPVNPQETELNTELNRLPSEAVNTLKKELNPGDMDLHSLLLEDKVILSLMFELALLARHSSFIR